MSEHRYIVEPLLKLELDKKRFRVKHCPCGKDNKDGKFVPYVGHENKGYCHSCGETFLPELPKVEQWQHPQPTVYGRLIEQYGITNPDRLPSILFAPGVKESLDRGKILRGWNQVGTHRRGECVDRWENAQEDAGSRRFDQMGLQSRIDSDRL